MRFGSSNNDAETSYFGVVFLLEDSSRRRGPAGHGTVVDRKAVTRETVFDDDGVLSKGASKIDFSKKSKGLCSKRAETDFFYYFSDFVVGFIYYKVRT